MIFMRIAYLDMAAGASGDMLVAALLDAGMPMNELQMALAELSGVEAVISHDHVLRNSIRVSRFHVHTHEEVHERHLQDILAMADSLQLSVRSRERFCNAFRLLAEAEAAMHGIAPDDVHFHEVGAVDSIIDLAAVMAGLEYFAVDALYATPIPWPHGVIHCRHGIIPNPAPATVHLLQGFVCAPFDGEWEMVTPTAACVLKSLHLQGQLREFVPETTGCGAGSWEIPGTPGFLRITIGEAVVE